MVTVTTRGHPGNELWAAVEAEAGPDASDVRDDGGRRGAGLPDGHGVLLPTGDDYVILTPEGAAHLAALPEPVPPAVYATLYPTCRVQGCQDDPEPRSPDCYRHQLVDAF